MLVTWVVCLVFYLPGAPRPKGSMQHRLGLGLRLHIAAAVTHIKAQRDDTIHTQRERERDKIFFFFF